MSYELKIELTGEALELLRTLPQAGGRAGRAIARALDLQNELTIGYAQKNKMSGPRPGTLGVISNQLRSHLRRNDATVSDGVVDASIGDNMAYAAVHEFGFDGEVTVKSFVRKQRSRDLVKGKKQKLVSSGVAYVKSFTRHMRMPERSYIRSSISERLGDYNTALSAAVLEALGGAG
jgi:phage gpG-like protein